MSKNDSIGKNYTKCTVNPKFMDFSRSLLKTPIFKGIPGLDQNSPKFKEFQVFQVAYKPCSAP